MVHKKIRGKFLKSFSTTVQGEAISWFKFPYSKNAKYLVQKHGI